MTDDAASASLNVTFRDAAVSAVERQSAEQSVAAMMSGLGARMAVERAEEEKRNALLEKINAPIQKLIESDHEASAALAELQKMSQFSREGDDAAYADLTNIPYPPAYVMPATLTERAYYGRPPYQYAWSSHFQGGGIPHRVEFGPPDSGLGLLEGRTGDFEGARSDWLVISAGFGVGFGTQVRQIRTGYGGFDQLSHYFNLAASGIGSWSLAEGGVDWCAFENGRMIASGGNKLWRVRVSVGESRHGPGQSPGFNSPGLNFEAHPGRQYNFNLGLWIRMEKSGSSPFGNCGGQAIQRAQIGWMAVSG